MNVRLTFFSTGKETLLRLISGWRTTACVVTSVTSTTALARWCWGALVESCTFLHALYPLVPLLAIYPPRQPQYATRYGPPPDRSLTHLVFHVSTSGHFYFKAPPQRCQVNRKKQPSVPVLTVIDLQIGRHTAMPSVPLTEHTTSEAFDPESCYTCDSWIAALMSAMADGRVSERLDETLTV